MVNDYIVRLISSQDHTMDKAKLVEKIRDIGTDRHDPSRKQMFDDFYRKHQVDFFGTFVARHELEAALPKLKQSFAKKTKGDRGRNIVPDIAIVYDANRCVMIKNVYEGIEASDCFRFKTTPKDAFAELREI